MSAFPDQQAISFPGSQQRTIEGVLTAASGALMILPVFGKRSPWRWTAAVAGGALVYGGICRARPNAFRKREEKHASAVEHFSQSITIGKSASELFALWRNPDVLARIMRSFGRVIPVGENRLRWKIAAPFGEFEAEATLVEERTDELVHWQTTPGSVLRVDEYMRFRPAPQSRGTEATLTYDIDFSHLPAGHMLQGLASLAERVPESVVRRILANFKSVAETSE